MTIHGNTFVCKEFVIYFIDILVMLTCIVNALMLFIYCFGVRVNTIVLFVDAKPILARPWEVLVLTMK